MQPLRPRKRSRSIQSAQVILQKGLGWLRGYPAGDPEPGRKVAWLEVPEPGAGGACAIALSSERLRSSFLAREKLHRGFPVVLPMLVGDTDAWYRSISWRLELLQGAVHEGLALPDVEILVGRARLPAGEARRLGKLACDADLRPLLRALIWLGGIDACTLEGLPFVEAHRREFRQLAARASAAGALGLLPLLRLVRLAALDGEERVRGLLAVLADPRSFRVQLAALPGKCSRDVSIHRLRLVRPAPAEVLEAWPCRPSATGDADARLGPRFLDAIESLCGAGETRRRTALRLLDLAAPWSRLAAWDAWWREIALLEPERDRFRGLGPALRPHDRLRLTALAARLADLIEGMPDPIDAGALVRASLDGTFSDEPRVAATIARALEALPEEYGPRPPRASFLASWSAWPREKLSVLLRLGRALELHVRSGGPAALAPWSGLLAGRKTWSYERDSPDDLLLRGELAPDLIEPFLEALRLAGSRGLLAESLEDDDRRDLVLQVVARVVSVFREAPAAVERLEAVLSRRPDGGSIDIRVAVALADEEHGEELVRYLDSLAGGDADGFAELFHVSRKRLIDRSHIQLLLATASLERHGEIRRLLLDGGIRRVIRIGLRLAALAASGEDAAAALRTAKPIRVADRSWMARYPAALRERLCELARAEPKAKAAAASIFRAHFPALPDIEREVAALERQAPSAPPGRAEHMRRRLENLRRRLDTIHSDLPAAGVERLSALIDRRRAMAVLGRMERRLQAALLRKVRELTGVDLPREWRSSSRLDAVSHVLLLRRPSRNLALRLLRARAGPPPWDLRAAPRNRAFLERLSGAGIDPGPWLEGLPPRKAALRDGREVFLALEDDPLEVLLMGEPFRTCLAPGAMNFFSAVSNAADINKRVLFGRAPDGSILGRCLLALDDTLRILTFQPYERARTLGFRELAGAFARDLAAAMGTVTSPEGAVALLEASGWYDDGCWDIAGRLDFIEEEASPFVAALPEMPAEDLDRRLDEAAGGRDLDATILPLVLGMPEVLARPDLVEVLLRRVRLLRRFPNQTVGWTLCVTRLRAAGRREAAAEVARRIAAVHARRGQRACPHCTEPLLEEFLELGEPGDALRLLAATRPRGVRRLEDETGARARLAARALAALHREGAAARLAAAADASREAGAD